jgi:hypothetical protein
MSRPTHTLAALAVFAVACSDRAPMTTPLEEGDPGTAVRAGPPTEQLARLVALALADPAFRSELKARFDGSPYREHKLHFQRLLDADGGRARAAIARASHIAEAELARQAGVLTELEIYLPVPEHRQAWSGDERVLVATAIHDRDAPVAFDLHGRRYVLSPYRAPQTPVIALVPAETDFDTPRRLEECMTCEVDGDSGGGSGGGGGTQPADSAPGLYMTKAHFESTFEGWFKGSPEFEVHILGQQGLTDSLMDYQCAGERSWGPYVFNQDGTNWSGSVLLFSGTQIASYNAAHPNQNFRVFFVEDDDEPCVIRAHRDLFGDLLRALDARYAGLTAGNDSNHVFRRARAFQKILAAVASFIKSNDELIGNAIEDPVVSDHYPGYTWIVKGEDDRTNGWVHLEIR